MNQADQQFIIELAQAAGDLATRYASKLRIEGKPDGSLVTQADTEAEELIRAGLRQRWPSDTIVGEELAGRADMGSGRVWCIDPVDGTHNYVRGLPLWAVCIGMCADGVPVLGIIHAPALGLTWTAFRGQGAFCNAEHISVTDTSEIVRSDMIAFTTEATDELFISLPHSQRDLGSASLHAGYVASGVFKACLFTNWWIWDVVPGVAIGLEAGATACNLHGERVTSFAGFAAQDKNASLILAPDSCCDLLTANTVRRRRTRPQSASTRR